MSAPASRADGLRRIAILRTPLLSRWLLMLCVTYTALISLPLPHRRFETGLDPSWMLGLNWAHAEGLVAGRDIVFSYGPLGYLVFPDPISGEPVLALVFRIGLYLLSMFALYRLAWIMQSRMAAFWTVLMFGLGVALDALSDENQVVVAITAVTLLVLVDRSGWQFAELYLLSFLAGFSVLVKLNHGTEGVALFIAVVGAVAAQNWPPTRPTRRRLLMAVGLLPLTVAVLFLASTGSLLALGSYLLNGWQIVSGYSETMGVPGPLWQAVLAVASIAAAFGAVLLVSGDLHAWLPGLAPAMIATYFVFKHSIVRQPSHVTQFQVRFAMGLLFLLVCARLPRDRRLVLIFQLFSLAVGYAVGVERYPWFDTDLKARLELREAPARLVAFLHWPSSWDRFRTESSTIRARLRLPDGFHRLIGGGSVDAIPWDVDVVQSNGWKWQPRPVFQSYSAYTPALDELNGEHLESSRAAGFILLNFSSIDGRHPFLETPFSWRALLDRYDLKMASTDLFLLQHRQDSRFAPPAAIGHSIAHWGEDISVPQTDGLLLMGPHISPSLSGEMTALLFRSAAVYMESTFRSGRKVRWRCLPRSLGAGFLIQPFPQSLAELRELFLPDPPADFEDRVVSVRFRADKPAEYASEIRVDWSRLPVKAVTAVFPERPLPRATLTPLWLPDYPQPWPANTRLRLRREWIEVIPDTADARVLFDIGPGLGKFNTLVVRARFERTGHIGVFFGKQIAGRGMTAIVPTPNVWLDVYLNVSGNVFWEDEHGTLLRFDPVFSPRRGNTAHIAGIWGSMDAAPAAWPDVQFYPVPQAEIPGR